MVNARTAAAAAVLILSIAAGLSESQLTNQWTSDPRPTNEVLKTFNPLAPNSWMTLPSRVLQYWFPFFQPAYYPPYLRPSSPRPPTQENQSQTEDEETRGKSDNIFGMCKPSGDKLEALPPASQIEW